MSVEKEIEKTQTVNKVEQNAGKSTQIKAKKVVEKPAKLSKPASKPTPKPNTKPTVKDTALVAVANQLLDRFEKAFEQAKKQKDQTATNIVIYYVFKRLDDLMDAQGKLSDEATPEDISREEQYKEYLKTVFSKGFKDVAKLTFEQAKAIYKTVKEEKKAAKLIN